MRILVVLVVALLLAAGCNKSPDSGGTPSTGGPVQSASADKIFTANCANCHRMGSLGGGRAPDLSHEGTTKTADWIAAHIKNPKSHNGMSKMPAFEGKIPDVDIQTLASHIASMK